jgi:hypothetical protein
MGAIVGGRVYLLVALKIRSAINSETLLATSTASTLYGPRPTIANTYNTPLPAAEWRPCWARSRSCRPKTKSGCQLTTIVLARATSS